MDRRRRDSSAAFKSLLSRQLASITDTLAKASRRRDEEKERARRPSGASTATTSPTSPRKPTTPVLREDPNHGQPTPVTMYLSGGGDEDNSDNYHAMNLQVCEMMEIVRQERKLFDKTVYGKGLDGPERKKMEYLLPHFASSANLNAQKELIRAQLEAVRAVNEDKRILLQGKKLDELKDLMLKVEEDMDLEGIRKQCEGQRREELRMRAKSWARSIRSEFLIQTDHVALFKDAEQEKAELGRLEEEVFEHLIAEMEAQNAKDLEAVTTSRRTEEADEGGSKPAESPDDSTIALLLNEQEVEHAIPASPQLRGGEEDHEDNEHHQRPLAARSETEEAQREAPAAAASKEKERSRMSKGDYETTMARKQVRDIELRVRRRRAEWRLLKERAGHTSGLASDEKFEGIRTSEEARDCEDVKAWRYLRKELFQNETEVAEEACLDKNVEEELQRRTPLPEVERSYLLPPASPLYSSSPSYAASHGEAVVGKTSHFDAAIQGAMRGGHVTPLDNDPGALLAGLTSLKATIHLPAAEINDAVYSGHELRQMLAEFDRPTLPAELASIRKTSYLPEVETNGTVHGGDDVRQMLAEFDRPARSTHAAATISNDPRAMLEELLALSAPGPQELRSLTSEDFEDEDDDVSALRTRLERLTLSAKGAASSQVATGLGEITSELINSDDLSSGAIPYAVGLELELSGCEWAVAQGWMRCLFSSSLDSYEAQKEMEIAVAHAEEALQKTIASVMQVEEENRQKDEERELQRRLIVSNLAAGADAEEMERQIWQYRYDIVNITVLPDRDPLKRTQTAHVDFSSRETAVQASFTSGQVYGLIFDVKLAVPLE
ncbi:hypothetical protein N0V91_001501 [Didymella pomorum]|uniref:RRM domain-containing protein n=1 Tax=Didymella pomorum TaxID=749634 RepID=A0A9W8ZKG3_9PLEO|nr:hypothetical protein N0V91_001501 [Didymella pomorum]